ncbi:unnamed protein product [Rhizoctonia solani]|uniref:Uncharacterized protein n=1 Tax=Rhizoctonia solani TaxID=456999 RepID=A0A8H3C4W8_9AGAM|nr:unnamed protein product [Rhizoctonia solani]
MSQPSSILKKLFFLTLLCLTIGLYPSLCPSTASVGRVLGSGGQATPSPMVQVPGFPVSASALALDFVPPAQTGSRVTFLVQELTGATSRLGRLLATEANYVTTKLSSFIMRSYLHSRILILAPLPSRTIPVYNPSRTVNPAPPTPAHAWKKKAALVNVEELVYVQPSVEGSPRNGVPKVRLSSPYLLRFSFHQVQESLWLTLVGVVVMLEVLVRLEMLRPTPAVRLRALSQAGFDHQVSNTTAPESNKSPPVTDPIVVMAIQLVASLVLANSGREVLLCVSNNFLVCKASNMDTWLDAIVGRDLLALGELRASIRATVTVNRSNIRITAYNPEVNNLGTWGIDDTQDHLRSRWSVRAHIPTTHTPCSQRTSTPPDVDHQSLHLAQTLIPIHASSGTMAEDDCSGIDWYILGLIARNFSTCLRLSATPASSSVERDGPPPDSSHVPWKHHVHIRGISPDYHSVMPLSIVVCVVVPSRTLTVLLFGDSRHPSTEGTEDFPLCRGLLIEWSPQGRDSSTQMAGTSEANPILITRRSQKPIRSGYEVYRPPPVQTTPASECRLEGAREQLERAEQDMRVTEEAQSYPDESEHSEPPRNRTRRGGRRARERKERRVVRAEAAGGYIPSSEV